MKSSVIIAILLLCSLSCSKQSDDDQASLGQRGTVPRWEAVTHKDVTFSYYVTHTENSFQLEGLNADIVAVQPWLKLKGAGDELMEFMMLLEPATADSCRKILDNKTIDWKGFVFDSYPDDQSVLFHETNKTQDTGKQQSIIHFLIRKGERGPCAKLTYYPYELITGYDHKTSIFDASELSKAILKIAASVRLKD